MIKPLRYKNRRTGTIEIEPVYGGKWIDRLYGSSLFAKTFGRILVHLSARLRFVSSFYGALQRCPRSKKKVQPFIDTYGVEMSHFQVPSGGFGSFNDFFCRSLIPGIRAMPSNPTELIAPADGRYRCFQEVHCDQKWRIKGLNLSLRDFLGSEKSAQENQGGTLLLVRLCPTDYHRFHFPCKGRVLSITQSKGPLFSVNPLAIQWSASILSDNYRIRIEIQTEDYGILHYIAIGATNVGSIDLACVLDGEYQRGDLLGTFHFGGSALALILPPNAVKLAGDIQDSEYEVLCAMGQSLIHPLTE